MSHSSWQHTLRAAISAHKQGDLAYAKQLYEAIQQEYPEKAEIWFNLGLLSLAKQETAEAIPYFDACLQRDNHHVSANYYLANCYFLTQQFAKAEQYYEKTLALDPGHLDALNNFGALLLHEKKEEQALQCFSTAVAFNPTHAEARNNLAATLAKLQRYYQAAEHFRLLLEQHPEDRQTRYNYAQALLDAGNFSGAILQFERVLSENSMHADAEGNLGIAFLKSGQPDKAKTHLANALALKPDNPEIAYLYAALTGESVPDTAPSDYVKNLFEQYARHYEHHMVDSLHYAVPEKLLALLQRKIYPLPENTWRIADLGCGTGLSGMPFRKLASVLTGVDISERMLTLAKHKQIYDELFLDNLLQVLNTSTQAYDLLIAADTFNYMGNLSPVFAASKKTLASSGFLLFSLEASQAAMQAWSLLPHGRYVHSENYIRTLADKYQFSLIALEKTVLREQENKPVEGWLCLLQNTG